MHTVRNCYTILYVFLNFVPSANHFKREANILLYSVERRFYRWESKNKSPLLLIERLRLSMLIDGDITYIVYVPFLLFFSKARKSVIWVDTILVLESARHVASSSWHGVVVLPNCACTAFADSGRMAGNKSITYV